MMWVLPPTRIADASVHAILAVGEATHKAAETSVHALMHRSSKKCDYIVIYIVKSK